MFLYSFITAARENLSSWTVNVSPMTTVHSDAKAIHCVFLLRKMNIKTTFLRLGHIYKTGYARIYVYVAFWRSA